MEIERLDHIHIAVRSLDQAERFFRDVLGVTAKFSVTITVNEWALRSRIVPIGETGIEIIEPTSSNSVIAKFIEQRGEGLHAISFKVPNIEKAAAEIEAKGVRRVGETNIGRLKEVQFHPRDSYGVMIELCEYETRHGCAEAALGR